MLPLALAPTQMGAPTCTLCAPLVSVKHSSQKIPFSPLMLPVLTLLPEHALVSGNFCRKYLSIVSLFCCAVWGGLDVPAPMVMPPSPLGLSSVTVSLSLLATLHPEGIVTVSLSFDTELPPPAGCVDGDAFDDGDTAGDGLETDWKPAF